ncbi:preprotein translocase subunit YajC [Sediminispirochaeta smaragdinae]|jgi:preprotein translocase subunit YajC|uniref:Sec translocon accessory complex subunit YajC n=1 Tax=Sediminispirochaeta smaragdinae (strain DSM 11293 / JCM 15392 / SEBR 4228) TaxID=573413 RepID=E1R5K8_SEDSS|nr:preprotein translocase subunit YajC [Sediminispirochaeta smaragdinae]ADK82336.1 preprotein translocase, YajC subunit [Sediminispirochaeta smaragdinae DSM 11293]
MMEMLANLPILMGAPEGAAASGGSGQMMTTFVTFGLVILIFYFLIIRPQNKKQKDAKRMLEALKKGDRVVSIGGIRGTVVSVKDQTVVLKVDDNTKLEFTKSAISTVVEQGKEEASSSKKDA